ncbi:uncharacterized protein KQ657_002935 [Scheffersomyces spartinae]|uniref:Major facilitator superfamily (MFS) profile domain-containing protein n=1 Tax=Scheffersomyces spartinae TaxID=45513 RepID=A0A9P8AGF3_9ASCO|nr:uncharacterized protein KQ657_002935 [Scheffersomyces spartinae]KAG7191664.1 hypothetical protein KQ657_002935 [Scheffersomyces spartinae]
MRGKLPSTNSFISAESDSTVVEEQPKKLKGEPKEVERTTEYPEAPHSLFTNREKYFIVVISGMCGCFSSISSPIYLPVLPIMEKKFGVSEEQMNITVVVYSIFQGLSPVVFSNFSDIFGRRIIILICMMIYICANVGLALNSSFGGLVFLRCLQAFGISLTFSISSGIASDMTTKSNRAGFIGLASGLSLLGQAFGALLGGLISSAFNWRAIFWFLTIGAGVTLIIVLICLPETARNIVGNGATLPEKRTFISVAPIMHLPNIKRRREITENVKVDHPKIDFLAPFKIMASLPVILILIPSSICYALWLMMLTTMSTSLTKKYNYTLIHVALAYIPSGIGGLTGSITIGRLLNWQYKLRYKKYLNDVQSFKDRSTVNVRNQCVKFNIFKARLYLAMVPVSLCVIGSLILGWSIEYKLPVALIMFSTFIISFGAMNFLTISTTVLVDLHPGNSSASSSCVNLTRCLTAAVFVAVLSSMSTTMTIGGCYTFMAGLVGFCSLTIVYIIYKSDKWI